MGKKLILLKVQSQMVVSEVLEEKNEKTGVLRMNKGFESLSPSAKWIIIKNKVELVTKSTFPIKNGWLLPSGKFCACEFSEHQSYLAALNYLYDFSSETCLIKFNFYDDQKQYSIDIDAYSGISDQQLEFFMTNIDHIDNLVVDTLLNKLKRIDTQRYEDYVFILNYKNQ